MTKRNLPLDVIDFEFLKGAPDSTRAVLEIQAGPRKIRLCLDKVQLELLALKANKAAAMLAMP